MGEPCRFRPQPVGNSRSGLVRKPLRKVAAGSFTDGGRRVRLSVFGASPARVGGQQLRGEGEGWGWGGGGGPGYLSMGGLRDRDG